MPPADKYAVENGISAFQFITPEQVLAKTAYCRFVAANLVVPNCSRVNPQSAVVYRKLDSLFISNKSLFLNISVDYDLINIQKVWYYLEFPLSNYLMSPTFNDDYKGMSAFIKQLGYKGKGTPMVLLDSNKNVVFCTYWPERDYEKIKAIITKKSS